MGVNLFGVMVGTQRAARHMAEHGGGSIINTTSIAGINAGAGLMVYRVVEGRRHPVHPVRSRSTSPTTASASTASRRRTSPPRSTQRTTWAPIIRLMQPLQRHGDRRATSPNAVLYLASDRAGADHRDRAARSTVGRPPGRRRASSGTSWRSRKETRDAADLVIRGGTVVDGTGAPGRVADVAIADGVIREIGPNLRGDRELDASGCVVAPGFIDIHTHYDAQVFWDPALRPSSYHGVTTVVAGNCGFTIAPTRPEHHDVIVRTLENVEDMDAATLTAGIVWDFETFPEYLDAGRAAAGTVLNFTAYVGHSRAAALRDGRRRLRARRHRRRDRADVPARARGDRRRRGRVLDQLLLRAPRRRRQAGPEPLRRRATRSRRCSCAAGETGKGVVLITPGEQCTYADVYEWQPRVGRPFTYPLFARAGRQAPRAAARAARGRARRAARRSGRRSRPGRSRCSSRWPTRTASTSGTVFGELHEGRPRRAHRRVPRSRRGGRGPRPTSSRSPMRPRWETFEVSESAAVPRAGGPAGERARARARRAARSTSCASSRSPRTSTTRFRVYIANDDVDERERTCSPTSSVALGPLRRGRARRPAVRRAAAHRPARHLGARPRGHAARARGPQADRRAGRHVRLRAARLPARGLLGRRVRVRSGRRSAPGPTRRVRDFPADGERLTAEEPTGVRHVLVNGTPIRRRRRAARRARPASGRCGPRSPDPVTRRGSAHGAEEGRADPRRTARAAPWRRSVRHAA